MIPFSPPKIYQEIIDEVVDSLKSGWITTGPKTKKFEKKLSEYNGNPNTLCVNSATAGLELVLRWFGVGEGDEVILPAYTYCATANVIMHCGAKPVFVDVNTDDFNISVEEIEKAITEKTKVIMPVDFGGFPCDYDTINKIAEENRSKFQALNEIQKQLGRILILSDAAHSLGGKENGKMTGSLADVTVFSFHAVKNLTTAEGGAIAFNLPLPFNNQEIYNYFNTFSLHGQNKDALAKTQIGNWRYDVIMPGYKANMPDVLAAIGLVELERYDEETIARRIEIIEAYNVGLGKYYWAELPVYKKEGRESSYHLYPLRIKNISEKQRDEIIQEIYAHEVSVNVHFQPVPMLSFYKNAGYKIENYPVAFDNYSREITLPLYFSLTDENVQTVIDAVIKSVEKVIG